MDVLLLVVKATVLLALSLAVSVAWRRSPRRVHRLWTLTFVALVALPILSPSLPSVRIPVINQWLPIQPEGADARTVPLTSFRANEVDRIVGPVPEPSGPATSQSPTPNGTPLMPRLPRWLVVWVAGTFAALAMLLLSVWRVRQLSRNAQVLNDPAWRQETIDIAQLLGGPRTVRLLVSEDVVMPMAGQTWTSTIFLPVSATTWGSERRRAVLGHEIAHLVAHDPRRHLLARLMLAMYWFHPLAWLAARWDAQACEIACDETVVDQVGIRRSTYATALLDLSSPRRSVGFGAVAMARHSRIERRVIHILRDRKPAGSRALPVAQAVIAAALATAAVIAQPAIGTTSDPAGSAVGQPVLPDDLQPAMDSMPDRQRESGVAPGRAQISLGANVSCEADPATGVGMVVSEVKRSTDYVRSLSQSFGELHLCYVADGHRASTVERPSVMAAVAARSVLQVRYRNAIQRLEFAPKSTAERWSVNGVQRPVEGTVNRWHRSMLTVLDTTWQIISLNAEVKAIQADIAGTQPSDERRMASLKQRLTALDADRRVAQLKLVRASEVQDLRQLVETIGGIETPPASAAMSVPVCEFAPPGESAAGRGRRVLRETFEDLSVCIRIDEGNVFEAIPPSQLLQRARYAVVESRRGGEVRQIELQRGAGGALVETWRVNGEVRPIDAAAANWRARILPVIETSWQIWALRGEEGLLNGRISLLLGQVSTQEIGTGAADRQIERLRRQIDALDVDRRIAQWNGRREIELDALRRALADLQ